MKPGESYFNKQKKMKQEEKIVLISKYILKIEDKYQYRSDLRLILDDFFEEVKKLSENT